MAIGATFGRMVGILVQALHEAHPSARFFAACSPDVPCITPGTYAFLGAGAALSGIMHITVSVVVIMFELTGALTYILPTMIVVGVTKAVSSRFAHGGIADRMIWFNGFPYLDTKDEHSFGIPVSQIMVSELTVLPSAGDGLTLNEVEGMLKGNKFQGFPVVGDRVGKMLLGYLGRTELLFGIERARRERLHLPGRTRCLFTPPPEEGGAGPHGPGTTVGSAAGGQGLSGTSRSTTVNESSSYADTPVIDFSRFIDPTPLTVHPSLPLETVMEIFKKLGPRVVLVEHRGRLTGLVTIKDCLAYQAKVENRDEGRGRGVEEYLSGAGVEEGQERLWEWIVWCVQWVSWKIRVRGRPPSDSGSEIMVWSDDEDDEDAVGGDNRHGEDEGGGVRMHSSVSR